MKCLSVIGLKFLTPVFVRTGLKWLKYQENDNLLLIELKLRLCNIVRTIFWTKSERSNFSWTSTLDLQFFRTKYDPEDCTFYSSQGCQICNENLVKQHRISHKVSTITGTLILSTFYLLRNFLLWSNLLHNNQSKHTNRDVLRQKGALG